MSADKEPEKEDEKFDFEAVLTHLKQLIGLEDSEGKIKPDWLDDPLKHLKEIPKEKSQRDAIAGLLGDVWPKNKIPKKHPLLGDDGKPAKTIQWLELPGRKSEDPKDGYPKTAYIVTDAEPENVAIGFGLTHRIKPGSGKLKNPKLDKDTLERLAKKKLKQQFVVQPFVFLPVACLPETDGSYFATGTKTNPLRFGLDLHLKDKSLLSTKSFNALRLQLDFAFRPKAQTPSFKAFVQQDKDGDFKKIEGPEFSIYLNMLLKLPEFMDWFSVLLAELGLIDILKWLEDLALPLPEFHFPSIDLDFEVWFDLVLASLRLHLKLPDLDLSALWDMLRDLELPAFDFPDFDIHFSKEVGFGFAIKDKVLKGPKKPKKGDKKKAEKPLVTLQLGETFGEDPSDVWPGKTKPGVHVGIGTFTEKGFDFDPTLSLTSIGLDFTGTKKKPLVDVKGTTLQGFEPRLNMSVASGKITDWGIACKLQEVALPVDDQLSKTGGKNAVAKSLIGGGGKKKKADAKPTFGIRMSYRENDRLHVQLYDTKDKPTDTVMTPMQAALGPLHLSKVGVGWRDKAEILSLIIDGDVKMGPLTIGLEHLSVGAPIDGLSDVSKYELGLEGIGITYDGGAVDISGAFVEKTLPTGETAYEGVAAIKAADWSIGAIGSYAQMKAVGGQDGYTSLFVFALVDAAIGGPPSFFVEGLAGGFGYNRRFITPEIDEIPHFPLIRALSDPTAIGGKDAGPDKALGILDPYVPPAKGTSWLALGAKFSSYELVETKALVVVEFGNDLSISVLGLSKMTLPKEGKPIAVIELALEVTLKPTQGTLLARANLTNNSWVIDEACKLSGGFAFALWFGTNPDGAPVGDFVLTLGGYHPDFKPPSHYPKVDRLAFNWPVSGHVTIKGDAYFALTPAQVMAGGSLEVLFHDGDLKAWFTAKMDALIGWDPFHYRVNISVSIGASYKVDLLFTSVTLHVEMSADLVIWGPPMGGKAHVHWFVIGFTVGFGASESTKTPTIPWTDFETRLLPQPRSPAPLVRILSPAVEEEVQMAEKDYTDDVDPRAKRWIVRPDHFSFSTTSTAPATSLLFETEDGVHDIGAEGPEVSIRPMQLKNIKATQKIWIEDRLKNSVKSGQARKLDLNAKWRMQHTTSSVPQAVWGAGKPAQGPESDHEKLLLRDALNGFDAVRPKHPDIAGPQAFTIVETLKRLPVVSGEDINHLDLMSGNATDFSGVAVTGAIGDVGNSITDTQARRDEIFASLQALGINAGTNDPLDKMTDPTEHVFESDPLILHTAEVAQ